MKQYKDIINFSIVHKLKQRISDACIIFNNLVRKDNINQRESEFYEVYTLQYQQDMNNLRELRDRCMHVADECNKIMLEMNTYHIKQYYLNPDELSEYEDFDKYKDQLPTEAPTQTPSTNEFDDEEW